ncbi:MAG: sugar-binding transcriptional regulator [Alphaproteobacteria bacterium]|nr:sugar-binding transcriptional regulator [Alphaproteobacteria bacterium]
MKHGTRSAEDGDLDLATRAAWLSYIGGYTQGDIAKRLGVSRAKAHRLIAQAHDNGLVKVFIEGEPAECIACEEVLVRRFGLCNCIVAPALGETRDGDGEFAAVGAAAARFLHRMLFAMDPGALVGVGKGRSLAAAIARMPALKRPDLRFVSVSGSLTRKLSANPFDVVQRLVERSGGEGYFLPVPYLAASVAEKEVLLAQKSVQDMLGLARRADMFVIGIGTLERDAHIRQVGMVSEDEWTELRGLGAIGDIMGSFIDIEGRPVDSPVNGHALGLGVADLRGRRVVAVVAGNGKAKAVLGALRTGIVTDLVVSEKAARWIADAVGGDAAPLREVGT